MNMMTSEIKPAGTMTSRLEKLPPETLTHILVHLDPPSLVTVAQCSRFLHDFIVNDELLVAKMMLREIGPTVLPDAVVAHYAPRNKSGRFDEVRAWCEAHLKSEQRLGPDTKDFKMNLKTASAIWGLHQNVCELVPLMVEIGASRNEPLAKALEQLPLSHLETTRFYRALYRFEAFHKLADGCHSGQPHHMQHPIVSTLLHRYYGFVDIAQQTCVGEMLSLCAASVFNIVASEDILWGARRYYHEQSCSTGTESRHLQYLVTRGLHDVHRFLTAKTYDDQADALTKLQPAWGRYNLRESGILGMVGFSIIPDTIWTIASLIGRLTATTTTSTVASFPDVDSGPADIAKYIRTNDDLKDEYFASGLWFYSILREWGYAMWDQKRLNKIGLVVTTASIAATTSARRNATQAGKMVLGVEVDSDDVRKLAWYLIGKRGRCPEGWPAGDGPKTDQGIRTYEKLYDEDAMDALDPAEGKPNYEEEWNVSEEDFPLFFDEKGDHIFARTWVGDWN